MKVYGLMVLEGVSPIRVWELSVDEYRPDSLHGPERAPVHAFCNSVVLLCVRSRHFANDTLVLAETACLSWSRMVHPFRTNRITAPRRLRAYSNGGRKHEERLVTP